MSQLKIKKSELRKRVLHELEEQVPKFAKQVAPLYERLHWTWWGEDRVPKTQDIIRYLHKLIKHTRDNRRSLGCSAGGLSIEIEDDTEDGSVAGVIAFTYNYRVYAYSNGDITRM